MDECVDAGALFESPVQEVPGTGAGVGCATEGGEEDRTLQQHLVGGKLFGQGEEKGNRRSRRLRQVGTHHYVVIVQRLAIAGNPGNHIVAGEGIAIFRLDSERTEIGAAEHVQSGRLQTAGHESGEGFLASEGGESIRSRAQGKRFLPGK